MKPIISFDNVTFGYGNNSNLKEISLKIFPNEFIGVIGPNGSGKTTLLNHILHNKAGLKVAVIVNDMSEVNIDAQFLENENTLSRTEEKLVEMSNGCICCTLREDLMVEVEQLAKQNKFDYLLIESTGISEPIPVAQTFTFESEDRTIDLSRFSYIDTMVTVVDAFNFLKDFSSADYLTTRKLTNIEGDDRTIVNLLTDQIEFANVILLNKTDLVSEDNIEELKAIIDVKDKIVAPISKGSKIGVIKIFLKDKEIARTDLITNENVNEGKWWEVLVDDLALKFKD